jgi:hypothetical protein
MPKSLKSIAVSAHMSTNKLTAFLVEVGGSLISTLSIIGSKW